MNGWTLFVKSVGCNDVPACTQVSQKDKSIPGPFPPLPRKALGTRLTGIAQSGGELGLAKGHPIRTCGKLGEITIIVLFGPMTR